ncbi:MAG: UDP-N-acetylmuramate dehydrogenase [Gammaproteobacteria bacterium]|nr:UDP-N-acetylmuramate dehydrogenase [Gammaproteobacteria bacterium]
MIATDVDLQPLNTLAIPARAAYFARVTNLETLRQALEFARQKRLPILPLGGGSNLVLVRDFPGLVIQLALRGVSLAAQADGSTLVTAAAGENWHQLVMHTVAQNLGGLENLALIPGNVGAVPIQNIGAYGVELKSCFHSLCALCVATGGVREFSAADCGFGYRDSMFKGALRDQYIVCTVRLRLPKKWAPQLQYPALGEYFSERGQAPDDLSPRQLAQGVIEIRKSKLPDPKVIPNAGSFFKNPVVSEAQYQQLKAKYPDLVAFAVGEQWKLAAGWLIERAGWRGVLRGGVGMHEGQALVLVNPGRCNGAEVTGLAAEIAEDVRSRFAVELKMEPQIYG